MWWDRLRAANRAGDVSLSMVALVVSLTGALALGLSSWVPGLLAGTGGIVDVEPGLLEVAQGARGVESLGTGLSVALYDSGFRLSRSSTVLADTVTRGSPISAVLGHTSGEDGHPDEVVEHTLRNLRVDTVLREDETVVYSGVVFDDAQSRTLPVRIGFSPVRGRIRMEVDVPGADAVVVHLDWRPATTGIEPALPARNLKFRAYWVDPTAEAEPAFTWILGTDVAIDPLTAHRAVDLRQDGRIAIHVWASTAVVTVTDTPRPPVSDSSP